MSNYIFTKQPSDVNITLFMILAEELEFGFARVKFTKQNGDIREMLCTQHLDDIPIEDHPISDKPIQISTDQIRVYEPTVGWRSFNASNLISFETAP